VGGTVSGVAVIVVAILYILFAVGSKWAYPT
jgi:hypothetical protein